MKFSQVTPNTTPALADYLMGVTAGNVDFRTTIQNLVTLILKTTLLNNLYKFRVSIAAATNTANTSFGKILFDTKQFDTSSNVDVVTNKGRFTAPVSGFYTFSGAIHISGSGGTQLLVALYKNGVAYGGGSYFGATLVGGNVASVVADDIQLSAGDYVEMWVYCNGAAPIITGTVYTHFEGRLTSIT